MESIHQMNNKEEKASTTVAKQVKDACLEFCDDTTFHGFTHVAKPSNHIALRIFWALCTTASAIYCIISCKTIFDDYYSRPTSNSLYLIFYADSKYIVVFAL